MFRSKGPPPQETLWIATERLAPIPSNAFYARVDRALANADFAQAVETACAPYYEMDASRGGRPGIDPVVYFKMLMVGFFEGLGSERAIAARCADSLSIRTFLHYTLEEATPDHSTLTVIRQRLGAEVYDAVFAVLLRALKRQRLLRGKRLAIDASVLEANASLRSLEHRLTGEAYQAYITRLADAAGVDTTDTAAVRRFDKKRPGRTTSNDDWENPHDPDAKIGRTKRGATRMIHKAEHVVDLDTGAILDVDVRPGDEHDTEQLAQRILEVEGRINTALGEDPHTPQMEVFVGDKGFYHVEELRTLQDSDIRTVVSDPIDNRRVDRLPPEAQAAVRAAKRAVQSQSGKALLRRRGELVERSFEHVLDCGGARRTTLRGRVNVRKRYLVQAMCANLSLLLRTLGGPGTLKQTWAASLAACLALFLSLRRLPGQMWARLVLLARLNAVFLRLTHRANPLAHARR
jgi:transposase